MILSVILNFHILTKCLSTVYIFLLERQWAGCLVPTASVYLHVNLKHLLWGVLDTIPCSTWIKVQQCSTDHFQTVHSLSHVLSSV